MITSKLFQGYGTCAYQLAVSYLWLLELSCRTHLLSAYDEAVSTVLPPPWKSHKHALTSNCPKRQSQNRIQSLPSPCVAFFLSGLVLLPSESEGTTKGFSFDTFTYCPARDCSIASLSSHLCLYHIRRWQLNWRNSRGVFLSDTQIRLKRLVHTEIALLSS